jgi:hypothetical protein
MRELNSKQRLLQNNSFCLNAQCIVVLFFVVHSGRKAVSYSIENVFEIRRAPMRIYASIAVCFAVLSGAYNIQAGQSPAASSQEASCSITGRVTIENEAAPDIAVVLQPATGSFPIAPTRGARDH